MKRELTLEQRITRLEKLLNGKVKKSRKFESMADDIDAMAQDWFTSQEWDEDDYWVKEAGSKFDFVQDVANKAADPVVDACCDAIGVDADSPERDIVENALAAAADIALSDPGYWDYDDDDFDYDDDDDWDDEIDECRGRSCESRKRRTESKRSLRRARNEDVKKLPNGALANRVSDVLSAWADTSWSRPKDAIRELDRKGILDAATNKWYPTVKDVADAIEDCWEDQIGAVGAGTAQFFIGNIGGQTKCSLTLYPVSGGTSRARNIVLKFNWQDEDMM